MGQLPVPAPNPTPNPNGTCVFHAGRTEELNEIKAVNRQVEARLGAIAERLAVGDKSMSELRKDINAWHELLREQKTDLGKRLDEISEQIREMSRFVHVSTDNARRLDLAEGTLERIDGRLRHIEGIAQRREGIEDRVSDIESAVAEIGTEIRTALTTARWLAGVVVGIVGLVSTVGGWMISHAWK